MKVVIIILFTIKTSDLKILLRSYKRQLKDVKRLYPSEIRYIVFLESEIKNIEKELCIRKHYKTKE